MIFRVFLANNLGAGFAIICLKGAVVKAGIVLNRLQRILSELKHNFKDISNIICADVISSALTFLIILVFLINFIGTLYAYVLALNILCFFVYLEGFIIFRFQKYQNLCKFIIIFTFSFMFSNLASGNHLLMGSVTDLNNIEVKEMGFCKTPSLSQKISSSLNLEKPAIKIIKSAYSLDHENRFPCRTDPSRASEYFYEPVKKYLKEIYLDGIPASLKTDFTALMNFTFKQQGASLTDYSSIFEKIKYTFNHIPISEGYKKDNFYYENFKDLRLCDEKYAVHIATYQGNSEFLKSYAALAQAYSDQTDSIQKSLRLVGGRYDFEVRFNGKIWKGDAFSPDKLYTKEFYETLKNKLLKYRYEEDVVIVINNGSNSNYSEFQNANIKAFIDDCESSAKVIVADQNSIYKLAELIDADFDPESLRFKKIKPFFIDSGIPEKHLTCNKSHFEKIIKN